MHVAQAVALLVAVEGFVIARWKPLLTGTVLYTAKRLSYRSSSHVETLTANITSGKALKRFFENNNVCYLIDQDNLDVRPIGRNDFRWLDQCATYSILARSNLTGTADAQEDEETNRKPDSQSAMTVGNVSTSPTSRQYLPATKPSPSTLIFVVDDKGQLFKTIIKDDGEFQALCKSTGGSAGYLVDSQGCRAFSASQLVDRAVYTLPSATMQRLVPTRETFDFSALCRPCEIPLPALTAPNDFVCEDGWKDNVLATINRHYEESDGLLKERVPPMALVRCSRGGKTRALLELAHELRQRDNDMAILFVSFNDISSLQVSEQADPLQALCRRIVLPATRDYIAAHDKGKVFSSFCHTTQYIDPVGLGSWLGDTPAILLIDELNNLHELTVRESDAAYMFGQFLKENFIARAKRYVVFSSHIITALDSLRTYLDQSHGSARKVILQSLPHIYNLTMAQKIDPSIVTVRQVLRCGCVPGLIYDQRPTGQKEAQVKQSDAVTKYNELSSENSETAFSDLLKSFLTGDIDLVPAPLHILFDTRYIHEPNGLPTMNLIWIPLHFEFVVHKVKLPDNSWLQAVANSLASLCQQTFSPLSKEKSGEDWEAAFVNVLLLRCAAHSPENVFLPNFWFDALPTVQFNNFTGELVACAEGGMRRKLLSECQDWSEIEMGIHPGDQPTIHILYPTYAMFKVYGAFALYCCGGSIIDSCGFQMKAGSAESFDSPLLPRSIGRSFYIQGLPKHDADTGKNGWVVAGRGAIEKFFGLSGQNWTPMQWERLKGTLQA